MTGSIAGMLKKMCIQVVQCFCFIVNANECKYIAQ